MASSRRLSTQSTVWIVIICPLLCSMLCGCYTEDAYRREQQRALETELLTLCFEYHGTGDKYFSQHTRFKSLLEEDSERVLPTLMKIVEEGDVDKVRRLAKSGEVRLPQEYSDRSIERDIAEAVFLMLWEMEDDRATDFMMYVVRADPPAFSDEARTAAFFNLRRTYNSKVSDFMADLLENPEKYCVSTLVCRTEDAIRYAKTTPEYHEGLASAVRTFQERNMRELATLEVEVDNWKNRVSAAREALEHLEQLRQQKEEKSR